MIDTEDADLASDNTRITNASKDDYHNIIMEFLNDQEGCLGEIAEEVDAMVIAK